MIDDTVRALQDSHKLSDNMMKAISEKFNIADVVDKWYDVDLTIGSSGINYMNILYDTWKSTISGSYELCENILSSIETRKRIIVRLLNNTKHMWSLKNVFNKVIPSKDEFDIGNNSKDNGKDDENEGAFN